LVIKVSPSLEPKIGPLVLGWLKNGNEGLAVKVQSDPDLSVGAAHLSWGSGFLSYDLNHVCDQLLDALRETSLTMSEQLMKVK
jgi:hypothetical protein